MSPPLHRDWTNSHLFSSSIPNGHSTLALGDANGYAAIPQALHEMCVSWTSLFIDLYSGCLKIILTLVTLVTLVPCFYLVSWTAPISAHRLAGTGCAGVAVISSTSSALPPDLSGHGWWDFSQFLATANDTYNNWFIKLQVGIGYSC